MKYHSKLLYIVTSIFLNDSINDTNETSKLPNPTNRYIQYLNTRTLYINKIINTSNIKSKKRLQKYRIPIIKLSSISGFLSISVPHIRLILSKSYYFKS